jgi:cystathionine beta-lyase
MRTMPLRLERQGASGLAVAHWLESHPAVARVLHPGLPSHPDHALYRRDFTGSAGVFAFVLNAPPGPTIDAALERLDLFGLGFSWAGYESLVIPCDQQLRRTATRWTETGALIRLSIGLEDPADLIADLEQALAGLA